MSVQDGGEQVPAQPLRPKYTERSWKRADGKEGSKPCPRSVTGVVVAGPGRGEAFDVCVSKEHCAVHWGKEQREKKKRASAGPSDTEERAKRERQKEEAARARVEAKRDRWRKSLGAILEAVAERVKKAPSGAGGLLGQIVLGAVTPYGGARGAEDLVPRGTSAEDLVRHAAFIVLREEAKSWNAMDQFPKRVRAFGVDVEKIIEAVAPAAKTARCRKCGCTEDRACPGGCSWVKKPDPKTGLGLCSSCVRAAGAPRADLFLSLLCLANMQPCRGRFRDWALLCSLFAVAEAEFLRDRGDLIQDDDGRWYVAGWDEWQEGDVTPGRIPPSEASRRQGVTTETPPGPPRRRRGEPVGPCPCRRLHGRRTGVRGWRRPRGLGPRAGGLRAPPGRAAAAGRGLPPRALLDPARGPPGASGTPADPGRAAGRPHRGGAPGLDRRARPRGPGAGRPPGAERSVAAAGPGPARSRVPRTVAAGARKRPAGKGKKRDRGVEVAMVVTLESTSKLVELNGVPARIWEGRTESGIPVIAFVTRIAVEQGQTPAVYEQFERELRQVRSPSAAAEAFPARLVL